MICLPTTIADYSRVATDPLKLSKLPYLPQTHVGDHLIRRPGD